MPVFQAAAQGFRQANRPARRLIVDPARLFDQTLGRWVSALQPSPQKQNTVLRQTVPTHADGGNQKTAARNSIGITRGQISLSEIPVDRIAQLKEVDIRLMAMADDFRGIRNAHVAVGILRGLYNFNGKSVRP